MPAGINARYDYPKLRESSRVAVLKSKDEYSAGGVVVRRVKGSIHLLLILDSYGNWGLPKGHVECGESNRVAAVREVIEETGLVEVAAGPTLGTIDWHYIRAEISIHKRCEYFLMGSKEGKVTPQVSEGITDCRWFPISDVSRVLKYDNAQPVIKKAMEFLKSGISKEIL